LRLKCTKFAAPKLGRGVLPDPAAELKGPTFEERGQEGKVRSEEGEGKGRHCAVLKIP